MKINKPDFGDIGLSLVTVCIIGALIGVAIRALTKPSSWESKPINTSLTFTQTNRLVVTHYIIIPAAPADWSALTSRYPANVTRTTLKFE